MKPVYLEFCGINSFSEKAEIDFRKLLGTGLFGIFGDTGSGKSTILDCIHFALYGKIERSSGTDSINYKCDKAYVVFEFEITVNGERHVYQVRRERRRKNNVAKAFFIRLRRGKAAGHSGRNGGSQRENPGDCRARLRRFQEMYRSAAGRVRGLGESGAQGAASIGFAVVRPRKIRG